MAGVSKDEGGPRAYAPDIVSFNVSDVGNLAEASPKPENGAK
jgi:hypothetical protein